MAIPQDFRIDRALVRRRFSRRVATADATGFLAREVASRMAERLDYIRCEPARILDLGCGIGADLPLLAQRYPDAERVGIDFALPLLQLTAGERGFFRRLLGGLRRRDPQLVCADADALPLARASIQMVWSNLMLNWLHDPLPALKEMHRVLEVDGLLMFSTLGPDTLKELRAVLPAGQGERVHRFIDMHDLGDALVGAGFADPVMDMQMITLTYEHLDALLRDLREAGAANASTARPRGLSGKAGWHHAKTVYEGMRQDGRLPATMEIIFGHAWKAAARKTADGRNIVRFQPKDP